MTEEARQKLIQAIAWEHRLYEEAERRRKQAERWARRADLALRAGDESMASAALERQAQARAQAQTYEEHYRGQAAIIRSLKRGDTTRVATQPSRQPESSVEERLAELERQDRIERDLGDLKRRLSSR